jgi:nitrogenase iron protein NifH
MAIENFKGRGYAQLGGLILNRRNVEDELENVQTLAKDFDTVIVGDLERSKLVQECDKLGTTVMNKYPESDMAKQYQKLADEIMKGFEEDA